ncbi:MAG: UDP-N-acetylmuramate--L-alanine ligase [Blastochloris viridis]|uniref:UDP-N-acetylmuramate--L-alanine ligase n=1 Tax=Blastochloris viridis TaxID=1079 RepID=A0A6N4RBN8_BLAVI|nr:MAG: UDP-N-acetylmuramate--L-alanine ligase [Blastochloris viridis]
MKIFGQDVKGLGIHFVGVGGIGMSGLAEVLATQGATVSGSDGGSKGDFERLEKAGVKVFRGHKAEQVPGDAIVVLSTAIPADNPERVAAKEQGLQTVHRADVLAEIMKNYQTVAVSGTHGKTSTTALVYTALKAADVDAGIINGGVLNALGTNALLPKKTSGWLVVEADESDASFLKLKPTVAVITNIEPEHMDTYGTEEKLVQAFVDFANSAEMAVICGDDTNAMIVEARTDTDVITYGMEDGADVYTDSYSVTRAGGTLPNGGMGMAFDVSLRGGIIEDVVVALPGAHYVLNSLAALAVASIAKADVVKAAEGLARFEGVGRRFTKVGEWHGADVIDDYGHHPTEIMATLGAAKQAYDGKIVAVIQPHRYTRLRDLMDEFAGCAKLADVAVLLPVYSAGEEPIAGVSHEVLGQKMDEAGLPEDVHVVADEHGLQKVLHHLHVGKGDVIVCLGAGTITDFAKHLAAHDCGHGHGHHGHHHHH